MNIKILDSWLREYLKTKASPKEIAEKLSLTSVSVERLEKCGKSDFVYDIEITTNRPDLMSIIGLAREAACILPQFGIDAKFIEPEFEIPKKKLKENLSLDIKNDSSLVNRIVAAIIDVNINESPQYIKERLEASGIRSLNNVIDVTNYVMREIGYPTHVFDYDRLNTKKIIVRESKKGEKIKTLDGKIYSLAGGDIIAEDGKSEIIDLIAIMGLENSVVTNSTKRIVFFINHAKPNHVRQTSMNLGIRTEAAILNEKEIDSELISTALNRGVELFKKIAEGKLASPIIDIYPNIPKTKQISISLDKINKTIGVSIPVKTSLEILTKLGFKTKTQKNNIIVTVPTWRLGDIEIEEDITEEIARVYGYHKLPNIIPLLTSAENYYMNSDPFFWENRVKNTLKYWGFTEVYTHSMVSEEMLEGPIKDSVKIKNPLTLDMAYMRKTLVPSLLQIIKENKNIEELKIFELSNVYYPRTNDLPNEVLTLAGIIKKENVSFYEVKGIIEQLLFDLGIKNPEFATKESGGIGATLAVKNTNVGEIEILDENIADFELNFDIIRKHVSLKKTYRKTPKFPPIIEDLRLEINPGITYKQIVSLIKKQSNLIVDVSLLDIYQNKKTFRIRYQDPNKNLTNEEISKIREKIQISLEKELRVKIS
ncbi:MAG: phenylalanine--tRNA ligase subunit beta [Candidatus Levybacteria bacterium]|nr:phenylalanine--tRNA ligase subunit beta [Candidatus Levybacteria bacterium]